MTTTLNISDVTIRKLKREASRQGRTMSELVGAALRSFLRERPKAGKLPPLPSFYTGGAKVDIANRDALYDAIER